MRFKTLADWLSWQESLHPNEIDLGLDRVQQVWQRLVEHPIATNVITIAGTNGKGSCVALLSTMLQHAGYKVGSYTSPHIFQYNERIQLGNTPVSDEALCQAFARVDEARGDVSLTYFEFGTLAALDIFQRQKLDVALLEVGLGGRLDAVNIIDADVALLTSIGLDHQAWLGNDRESIGKEKAGIFKTGRPAVFGGSEIPASVVETARAKQVPLYRFGEDFGYQLQETGWQWWSKQQIRSGLPLPSLRGDIQLQNATSALMVLQLLHERLPMDQAAIREGLIGTSLAGRFQVVPGPITQIFDVAHNPDSAQQLQQQLQTHQCTGLTHAVVGMLQDKDVEAVARALANIDRWYTGSLAVSRGLSGDGLAQRLRLGGITAPIHIHESISHAYLDAQKQARAGDRILIFGSFYTVAEILSQELASKHHV